MNNKLLVDERQADLGQFMVGRLLPFRKKRQVGPFTFIDHMGPATLGPDKYVDVDQHPHIGLSTLTYLFEGKIHHRDSMGSDQVIAAGDVGFMTSGSGCTHTERTPEALRHGATSTMHGYQIWVALPKDKEEISPKFAYYPADTLPQWDHQGLKITLAAGNAFGRTAPLQGYWPMYMLDIRASEKTTLDLRGQINGEVAFVIAKGSITSDGQKVNAGQMLISKTDDECEICLDKGTVLMLFGGKPLPEERYLSWNFVSHSKERLAQAREDWENMHFPKVTGDDTYISFPSRRK